MEKQRDYIGDINEIRSMMERSSKFLSLSGWAGIMAGIYALAGAYIAHTVYEFRPDKVLYTSPYLPKVILLASVVLILSLASAIYFSWRNAGKRGEQVWNATSRRLLTSMAVPLFTGGIFIVILILKGMSGFIAPVTLIFYGLSLHNAGYFTIREVKIMGLVQVALGLINTWFIEYGLIFWAMGFGLVHIIYGIYMHFRYER